MKSFLALLTMISGTNAAYALSDVQKSFLLKNCSDYAYALSEKTEIALDLTTYEGDLSDKLAGYRNRYDAAHELSQRAVFALSTVTSGDILGQIYQRRFKKPFSSIGTDAQPPANPYDEPYKVMEAFSVLAIEGKWPGDKELFRSNLIEVKQLASLLLEDCYDRVGEAN